MDANTIKVLIEKNLPDSAVYIEGDDGVHFQAMVVNDQFEGLSLIKQHRLVYAALEGKIESQEVHALGLKTMTVSEFEEFRQKAGV